MKKSVIAVLIAVLVLASLPAPLTQAEDPRPLINDAFWPPDLAKVLSQSTAGPAPGFYQTSEILIGSVAVGIVLPESDGSVDSSAEDWTEAERALVLIKITAALDWWAALEPNAHLTFVYDDGTAAPITTGYEPISRRHSDQSLWIAEVMAKKGYTGDSYFDQVRQYNTSLREIYDTDWAFTIFVVDSSSDRDNRFADGYFAYAYLGGPFTVMTYGNNGYGPHNMDAVAAHEIGHIFLALDQYYSAYQPCTRQAGYLGVENQNSQYPGDCASNKSSIMRGQVWPYRNGDIDEYARGQIGWRDSDGDGILDPVDTEMELTWQVVTSTAGVGVTGAARIVPFPSPHRTDTTINTVTMVRYRLGGEKWQNAIPIDGAFDSAIEEFAFFVEGSSEGLEVQAINSQGQAFPQSVYRVYLPAVRKNSS